MPERPRYGLGCLKDPADNRDVPMQLVLPRITAPPRVDYTGLMSPVRNQGEEGTCVAFASVVGIKEYQEQAERRRLIELSPRYLYHLCKRMDGVPGQEGTFPRIAMKALAQNGVCPEECWPYQPYQTDHSCPTADEEALPFKIRTYARLNEIVEMERSLSINGPFLAGVNVFSDWFEDHGGKIPLPPKDESSLGGHAICIMGYSRSGNYFKFKNSWGTGWGDHGFGYLSYEYMDRHCLDAWSATDLIANPDLLAQYREKEEG
ncbi:MAG: C1 family peptidase [Candidatus Euphemobacter frigidus]|nr:C1 family peptidase [Candidatus Euphemobacter frigidus]MDP8276733.1 C1 family peptidase [Candidatus Euphemobacter frigidus]